MDTSASSLNSHKHMKEQFVSNLTGSSIFEIFILNAAMPVLMLLRHCFCSNEFETTHNSLKKNDDAIHGFKDWRACLITISMDFLTIVLPVVLFLTVLSKWTYLVSVLLALWLVFLIRAKRCTASSSLENDINSLRRCITSYRVTVMIITCFCILAVDFKAFPRRYAKTETYGTSLMDLGVGSFVFQNSLLSQQARGFSTSKLRNILQSTSPLLILGFGRFITTASVDYQVHVGEYGVHWNFFFTLAGVTILTTLINVPRRYSGVLGSLIIVGYQFCLMYGLNVYLLSNERGTDIISQNKEGIFSIFGYWGLYLVGVQLGSYLFYGNSKQLSRPIKWARIRVWILSIVCWLLTLLLDRFVERVSRRMCNATYVTFILAQSLQILSFFLLSDYIPGHKITLLEEAFNQNLLASFVLANLLTGLVNLSINTLSLSSGSALIILVVYAFVLSLFMGFAHFFNIRLKVW